MDSSVKSKRRAAKNADMTEGGIFGKFVAYALPFMLTNLLQVLYNAADIVVVGLSHEADAVGAVGTTTAFVNLITGLFIGCSLGAEVVISRAVGRKDGVETENAVHTALLFGVIFGAFCGALGFFLAKPVLALMGNEAKLLELASVYSDFPSSRSRISPWRCCMRKAILKRRSSCLRFLASSTLF